MSNNGQIHWHEGLFLQPHHLQAQQRQLLEAVADERRLAWSFPYGLVEARVSTSAIENLLVRFDRLRAVMPSGVVVDVPDGAELPPLDIREAFAAAGSNPFTIHLGVPLWYGDRANTVDGQGAGDGAAGSGSGRDDWRVKRIFRLSEVVLLDENTGQNPQPTPVRRINARLLVDGDDRKDLETIPVLRLARAAGTGVGLPRQDPAFIPPALVLTGSTALRDTVRDVANQVEAARRELSAQMARGGFSVDGMRGVQFQQALRLQSLGRATVRLAPLATVEGVTPFLAYQELKQLLAELSALEPGKDALAEVAPYDHDNLAMSFAELVRQLRARVPNKGSENFMRVPFARGADNLLTAALSAEHLSRAHEFFLGVQSRQDPRAVVATVENEEGFKLTAPSYAPIRASGVKLQVEMHPPVDLPSQGGLTYFRLLRDKPTTRVWDRIVAEHAAIAQWVDMDQTDFGLSLCMTIAEGKEPA
jgi:type VI secretion system protein ImpJ